MLLTVDGRDWRRPGVLPRFRLVQYSQHNRMLTQAGWNRFNLLVLSWLAGTDVIFLSSCLDTHVDVSQLVP